MTDLQLKAFIASAETLNFTTTSARLYLSQSTLSRQISSLENELGVKLFLRQNNVLELTDAGRFFYDQVKDIYSELDTAVRRLRDLNAGIEGELRIGIMSDQRPVEPLSEAIRDLLNEYHNLRIDIRRYSFCDLIENLESHEIDVAQALLYEGLSPEIYQDMPLTSEPMYLAYNPAYFFTDKTYINDSMELAETLEDYPIYFPSVSSYPESVRDHLPPPLPGILAANGHSLSSPSSAQFYLTIGLGATMINRNNIIADTPDVKMIPVRSGDMPPITQGLIWRKNTTNPVLHNLLKLLKEKQLPV